MTDGSPTVRRRRLGNRLRQARLAAGMTGSEVAGQMEISQSKVSRIESGSVTVRPKELRELLSIYGAASDEREELLDLARDRGAKGWWTRYASILPRGYASYIGFEAEASEIWDWQTGIVPGHLQTEGYVRALMAGAGPAAVECPDQLIEVRMERQRHLAETRPQIHAVLDESVLRRVIGDQRIMAEQLAHLVEAAQDPRVTIQVLPYDRGAATSSLGDFTVLSYADGMQVVWGESLTGESMLEEEKPDLCIVMFDHLRKTALDPAASLTMLERALERSAR